MIEDIRIKLERVQNFDTSRLPRTDILGASLGFSEAIGPAEKSIHLFLQIPLDCLHELPDHYLQIVASCANRILQTFERITEFSAEQQNAFHAKQDLLNQLKADHASFFGELTPIMTFTLTRQRDFASFEVEFRNLIEDTRLQSNSLLDEIRHHNTESETILKEIKKVAAEQGVSQQAHYFREEAVSHEKQADTWVKWLVGVGVVLIAYSVLTFFIHKFSWLTPTTAFETAQLATSKILVFAVIAYALILLAKNFMSHKHNAIVNKHRQNALLTFNALVSAAENEANRDLVLSHAAACIFSPQETGYTKSSPNAQSDVPMNFFQAISKMQ